jgi:hypothetical protein
VRERPLLLIDIDGVLNPWGVEECPAGFCEYQLFPEDDEPVRLAAIHGEWLTELAETFDLAWASAWGSQAHSLLGPILRIDEFPFVPMPPVPFPPDEKVPAIARYVGERATAWVDDYVGEAAQRWAAYRAAPTLLVHVDHTVGLTREHVHQLLIWARHLS